MLCEVFLASLCITRVIWTKTTPPWSFAGSGKESVNEETPGNKERREQLANAIIKIKGKGGKRK